MTELNAGKQDKQLAILLDICRAIELFKTSDDTLYAEIAVGDHRENWAIKGSIFKDWLRRSYYERTKSAPKKQSLDDCIDTISSKALFEGKVEKVYLRIGHLDDKIYVDLGNRKWEVIEISASGWTVLQKSPVRFRRSKYMQALPYPELSSDLTVIQKMKRFFNVETDDDFKLLIGFIVNAFQRNGPYLVLVLYGEQGASKSTVVKLLRALIDPSQVPLRKEPKNADDLMVSAKHSWVLAFDNVSHLPNWLSDDLCRVATGGGLSKRSLFTDDDEIILEAKRPIILNGIAEFVSRGDLASRSITLNLPRISEEDRKTESDFWSEFSRLHSSFFGCILNGVSAALRNEGHVVQNHRLRMADAWQWITAAEGAFGWRAGDSVAAFRINQESANDAVLSSSLIYPLIRDLAKQEWAGTPTDLLSKLNSMIPGGHSFERGWPTRPRQLTDELRRLAPSLKLACIEVTMSKTGGSNSERQVRIRLADPSNAANAANGRMPSPSSGVVGVDLTESADARIETTSEEDVIHF